MISGPSVVPGTIHFLFLLSSDLKESSSPCLLFSGDPEPVPLKSDGRSSAPYRYFGRKIVCPFGSAYFFPDAFGLLFSLLYIWAAYQIVKPHFLTYRLNTRFFIRNGLPAYIEKAHLS